MNTKLLCFHSEQHGAVTKLCLVMSDDKKDTSSMLIISLQVSRLKAVKGKQVTVMWFYRACFHSDGASPCVTMCSSDRHTSGGVKWLTTEAPVEMQ